MPSSNENQARLHQAYTDLLDEGVTGQNGANTTLLTLVDDLDRLFEPYRMANPPAELSRSIDLLARELAKNDPRPAPSHFWQIGPFGNRGDGGGSGHPSLPSDDHDPEPPRRWSLGRELAGIAAVIVILVLVGGALVAVFRGQNGSSSSPAALASPATTSHYPPLPELAKNNPGAEAVYKAGLGKHVNLTYSNNGYTWTIHWVYADAVQMIAFYTVTAPANVNIKDADLSTGLIFTDSAGRQYGGAGYSGMTLSANRSLDILVWASKNQSLATDVPTIKLRLDLESLLLRSKSKPHEVPSTVAHGTTIEVTVPYDIGHEIPVDKQAKLDGVSITLDHLRVAPSGIQAFFLYPKGSIVASKSVWGQLSAGNPGSSPCLPTAWSDSLNRLVFPCAPPKSEAGNWSITLQPYDETGGPTKNRSKWLTFTFPANPGASVATILPAQPLPSTVKTDGNSLGDPNAPVKVVEYGDYQCSACNYFYRNGRTQFLKDYVATGKVYFTFRDFPFFGPQSENAATAAWCANDQGKYWEFHDTMYGNQPPEGEHGITDGFLRSVASSIGLNMQEFSDCYASGRYRNKVKDDLARAKDLKIYGTPTFFVNGSRVDSADYSTLKAAVDKALQQCSPDDPGTPCTPPTFIGTPPAQSNAAATPNATPVTHGPVTFTDQDIKNSKAFNLDPGAQRVIQAGLGTFMDESRKVGQAAVDVRWVYADLNEIAVFYTVRNRAKDPAPETHPDPFSTCPAQLRVSPTSLYWSSLSSGEDDSRSQGGLVGCFLSAYPNIHPGMPRPGDSIQLEVSGNLGYRNHPEPKANFDIKTIIPLQPALVSAPGETRMLAGKPVTLDQLVITPTNIAFTVSGSGESNAQNEPMPRIAINGWDGTKSGDTGGGMINSTTHQVTFALDCPPAAYPKSDTWTITIFALDARGKTITNPADAAVFTVNLPTASWVPAASETPTP